MKKFFNINWKYALGEILIVILGISIAFGLNNWAARQKDQAQKQKYLFNLKKDLEVDILQLDTNIMLLQERIQNVDLIRRYAYTPNLRKDTLLPKIYQLPLPIDFRPRDITYKTLINSGDFKLIDDFDLKTAIQELYLEYEHIAEVYERQNILVDKYVSNFFMKEMDYAAIYAGDFSFMQSKFFSNMIGAQQSTFRLKVETSKKGIERCRNLIEQIK